MINNELAGNLKNFYNRSAGETDTAAETFKKLKTRRDTIMGRGEKAEDAPVDTEEAAPADSFVKSPSPGKETPESKLSPEQKRQLELKQILQKIEEEDAQRYPRYKAASGQASSSLAQATGLEALNGLDGFLNELPLFDEFKTGLMEAFRNMDSASYGFINAQYELNYTSMQYMVNAAGGFEYTETTLNIKFDLQYVKAAAGGASGAAMADAISGATDFESLMNNLESVGRDMANQGSKGLPELKNLKPADFLSSMQDYFSPEATAGRIVDFATALFPLSEAYKKGGDTEEARREHAEIMGKAIQKGFDQALGQLGAISSKVREGIDKTHELTFKGLDDFVKNGMNANKDTTYSSLQQFAFSFEMNYSRKSVSVGYGSGQSSTAALDAQA